MPYLVNEDRYRLVLWLDDWLERWEEHPRPEECEPDDPRIIGRYARTLETSGPWVGIVRTDEGPVLLHEAGRLRLDPERVLVTDTDLGEQRRFVVEADGVEVIRLEYPKRAYGWGPYCADEQDTDLFLYITEEYRTERFQKWFTTAAPQP